MSATETRTFLVRSCGHELDVTNNRNPLPAVGEYVACMSACDRVPWRSGARPRKVRRYETREVSTTPRRTVR